MISIKDTYYLKLKNTIVEYVNKNNINENDYLELGILYFLSIEEYYTIFYSPIISEHQKEFYGEVNTPLQLVTEMILFLKNIINDNIDNIDKPFPHILDTGAGIGCITAFYTKFLWNYTVQSRENWIKIIQSITLIEINPLNIEILKLLFGNKCRIICSDYLNYHPRIIYDTFNGYDIIIGNPPFNVNGSIKVPTNNNKNKKEDGNSIWREFVTHSLQNCLVNNGYLCYFIPSLWMKYGDKYGLYDTIINENKLLKVKCYNNTLCNTLFKGHAQTHCGIFLIQKGGFTDVVDHFSWYTNNFIQYNIQNRGNVKSIPVLDSIIERKLINKIKNTCIKYNIEYKPIIFYKTSTINKNTAVSNAYSDIFKYKNIKTCVLDKNKVPYLLFEYSDTLCQYAGKPKIVLAHGMYGIPFEDKTGKYGITKRDKYVIINNDIQNPEHMVWFLKTPLVSFMFENYKYRMRFIEKASFEWLIDISLFINIGFPLYGIDNLYKWFDFDENEINYITQFEKLQLK